MNIRYKKLKTGDTVKFKRENAAGKLIASRGAVYDVTHPVDGIKAETINTIELVTITLEVFNFLKDIFTVKIPLLIKIGDRNYCLNLRYDFAERVVFAYYRDEIQQETLIGEAYGKNTTTAKKKLKEKLKKAGYL